MKTNFDTLRALARYTINALSDKNLISFPIEQRADLIEAMATEYGVSFSTDEDIKDQAIEEVEEKLGRMDIEDITETEMYNHARKEIVKGFQGETISGLYMVESLNQVANRIKDFLMDCDLVDDVYATDEELVEFLIQKIRHFTPFK
jgi:hypothetical protein